MNILGPNPQRGYGPVDWSRLGQKRAAETNEVTPLNLLGSRAPGAPEVDAEEEAPATDLLIQGLVERLPKPDDVWPVQDRMKWLRTAVSVFALVYRTGEGEEGDIGVALAKPESNHATMPGAAPEMTEIPPAKPSANFSILGDFSS